MNVSLVPRKQRALAILTGAFAIALSTVVPARAEAPATVAQALAATTDAAWDLGIVLEMRRPNRDGMEVLAITPGGAADSIGLRPGDRLRAINGRALTGIGAADAYADAMATSGGQVRLDVVRDGNALQLSGALALASVRATKGCGYVTTLGATPRTKESIYKAEITMIDGDSTPLTERSRFELPAGRRVLVVAEHIDNHRFNNAQNRQRSIMKRRELARAYKALVVDVAPDTSYSIGARMLKDKLDSASIRANAYWEPVVWKNVATRCR